MHTALYSTTSKRYAIASTAKCDQEASHCLPETDVKPFACVHFLLSSTAPQEMGPDDVLDKSGSCIASGEELVLMQSGLSEKGTTPTDKYQFALISTTLTWTITLITPHSLLFTTPQL